MSCCCIIMGWAEEAALKQNGMTKSCVQQVNIFFLSWWVIYLLVPMVRVRSCLVIYQLDLCFSRLFDEVL